MLPDAFGLLCLAQSASPATGVSALTVGAFTLGGSLIAALAAFGTTIINRHSEDRRHLVTKEFEDRQHLREIAIKTAMQYWEGVVANLKLRQQNTKEDIRIPPPDAYIVHMLLLTELVSEKKLDASNAEAELRRILEVSGAANKAGKPPRQANQ